MTTTQSRLAMLILLVGTAASLAFAVAERREKQRIAQEYSGIQQALNELESERAVLIEELLGSKEVLKDLSKLPEEFQRLKSKLEQTEAELAALQVEYASLQSANVTLSSELKTVTGEKQMLEAKLNDINELKGAIRQIKREMWAKRLDGWRSYVKRSRDEDLRQLAIGNKGFLVRNGTSTIGAAPTKVQVRVLDPQTSIP